MFIYITMLRYSDLLKKPLPGKIFPLRPRQNSAARPSGEERYADMAQGSFFVTAINKNSGIKVRDYISHLFKKENLNVKCGIDEPTSIKFAYGLLLHI